MKVMDIDSLGAADNLGMSEQLFIFSTCLTEKKQNVRFSNLLEGGYMYATITYDPVNNCLTNNGNCGDVESTQCMCLGDNSVTYVRHTTSILCIFQICVILAI
eukprot:m.140692 g.140692  ORF g.140692 m.140692 type:complete len:103 (+) comp15968_c0_seq10:958-1266(+)